MDGTNNLTKPTNCHQHGQPELYVEVFASNTATQVQLQQHVNCFPRGWLKNQRAQADFPVTLSLHFIKFVELKILS